MKIELELTTDQLRDLRELVDEYGLRSPTVTGGSNVSSEQQRRHTSFREIRHQLFTEELKSHG